MTSSGLPRRGGGDAKVRAVERRAHGERLKSEADTALATQDARREPLEELESLGVVITIEGATGFPLKLESLEQRTTHHPPRPKWLLLSVHSATEDRVERAQVWVSDDYRPKFLERLEQFIAEDTPRGKPKHRALVANIDRIRATVLEDLWQSADDPPMTGRHWWEVWLQPNHNAIELANRFADTLRLAILERSLRFDDETIPTARVAVADIRPHGTWSGRCRASGDALLLRGTRWLASGVAAPVHLRVTRPSVRPTSTKRDHRRVRSAREPRRRQGRRPNHPIGKQNRLVGPGPQPAEQGFSTPRHLERPRRRVSHYRRDRRTRCRRLVEVQQPQGPAGPLRSLCVVGVASNADAGCGHLYTNRHIDQGACRRYRCRNLIR